MAINSTCTTLALPWRDHVIGWPLDRVNAHAANVAVLPNPTDPALINVTQINLGFHLLSQGVKMHVRLY